MVTVKDIILKTDFDGVFAEYKKHYEKDHKTKVMDIFQKLNEIHPSPNGCRMVFSRDGERNHQSSAHRICETIWVGVNRLSVLSLT